MPSLVQVTFDPRRVSLGRILQIYFSVTHDPTELNFQGPDTGTQYRSAIFYQDDMQKNVAEAYIAQLDKAELFKRAIVTKLDQLAEFYPAETYHQNFATLHPDNPVYCRIRPPAHVGKPEAPVCRPLSGKAGPGAGRAVRPRLLQSAGRLSRAMQPTCAVTFRPRNVCCVRWRSRAMPPPRLILEQCTAAALPCCRTMRRR